MRLILIGAMAAFTAAAMAQPELAITLGIRESGDDGLEIGTTGTYTGGFEWVDLDNQTLVLDGTWQKFTFDMAAGPISEGLVLGDGVLDGNSGIIEELRIRNIDGVTVPISLWIDDIANTITIPRVGEQTTTFGDFEGFADGDEVIFQEPGFSGSTSGNLTASPNVAGVDSSTAFNGEASYNVQYQYIDADTAGWLRLTTFIAGGSPINGQPVIRFDQDSVVSFWVKGVPEPSSLLLLSLGLVGFARRR
jgi:hypothetical protein